MGVLAAGRGSGVSPWRPSPGERADGPKCQARGQWWRGTGGELDGAGLSLAQTPGSEMCL